MGEEGERAGDVLEGDPGTPTCVQQDVPKGGDRMCQKGGWAMDPDAAQGTAPASRLPARTGV